MNYYFDSQLTNDGENYKWNNINFGSSRGQRTKNQKAEKFKSPASQYQNASSKYHISHGKYRKKSPTKIVLAYRKTWKMLQSAILPTWTALNDKFIRNKYQVKCLFLDSITLKINRGTSNWIQEIVVGDTTAINFKLDTAAQANIIPKNILHTFYTSPL